MTTSVDPQPIPYAAPSAIASPRATMALAWGLATDVALALACMMPVAIIPLLPPAGSIVVVVVALAAFLWVATRHRSNDARIGAIGFGRPSRPVAALLVPTALALGVAGLLVQSWFHRVMPHPATAASALDAYETRPFGAAVILFFILVYAPIVEEFIFRRRMMERLRGRFGRATSVAITAGLFAALHLNLWTAPFMLASGVVFGLVAVCTGTIWPAVLLHAATNAETPLLTLIAGRDARIDRWLDSMGVPLGVQALLTVAAVAATVALLRRLVRQTGGPEAVA